MKSELILALEQIEREKGVPKEEILKMIEGALVSALRKHVGKLANIEAVIDPDTAAIKAWWIKKVVEKAEAPEAEVTLTDLARLRIPGELGSDVRIPLDPEEFARIAAQTAKQVLVQKIREIERDNLYVEYKPKENEVVNGSVQRFLDRNIIVDLGKAEGILPVREQIRKERYSPGDRIRAVILKVDKAQRGPQVLLSRASPVFLKKVFEMEIPEVAERIVEVGPIVRDPGFRAKVVVRSNNPKVDPIGACVGIRGSRIRSIMNEVSGEKIDLINGADETEQFVANSLAPARVSSVRLLDKEAKRAEVTVPDDQLSLAIGKDGNNIRLASRLTGWNLDVKSEGQKRDAARQAHEAMAEDLTQIDGVGPKLAETLVKAGLADIAKLAGACVEDLTTLQGMGEKTALKVISGAQEFLSRRGREGGPVAVAAAEAPVPAVEGSSPSPESEEGGRPLEQGESHEGESTEQKA